MVSRKSIIFGAVFTLTVLAAACGKSVIEEDESLNLTGTEEQALIIEVPGPNGTTLLVPTCENDKKAVICHIPPGNPANAHAICVGKPAVNPHVRLHADYPGDCVRSADGGILAADGGVFEGAGAPGGGQGNGAGPGEGGGNGNGAGGGGNGSGNGRDAGTGGGSETGGGTGGGDVDPTPDAGVIN